MIWSLNQFSYGATQEAHTGLLTNAPCFCSLTKRCREAPKHLQTPLRGMVGGAGPGGVARFSGRAVSGRAWLRCLRRAMLRWPVLRDAGKLAAAKVARFMAARHPGKDDGAGDADVASCTSSCWRRPRRTSTTASFTENRELKGEPRRAGPCEKATWKRQEPGLTFSSAGPKPWEPTFARPSVNERGQLATARTEALLFLRGKPRWRR